MLDEDLRNGHWVSITLEPSISHSTFAHNTNRSLDIRRPSTGSCKEFPILGGHLYALNPEISFISEDSFVMHFEKNIWVTTNVCRKIDSLCRGINLVEKQDSRTAWNGTTLELLVLRH